MFCIFIIIYCEIRNLYRRGRPTVYRRGMRMMEYSIGVVQLMLAKTSRYVQRNASRVVDEKKKKASGVKR